MRPMCLVGVIRAARRCARAAIMRVITMTKDAVSTRITSLNADALDCLQNAVRPTPNFEENRQWKS
jgi:hypothetical protein